MYRYLPTLVPAGWHYLTWDTAGHHLGEQLNIWFQSAESIAEAALAAAPTNGLSGQDSMSDSIPPARDRRR